MMLQLIFIIIILFFLPFSIFVGFITHFYIFEIYLLLGFLAILLYVLIFRLNSHIKLSVWYLVLLYLSGALFFLCLDLNLTQIVYGIQKLQPMILVKILFTIFTIFTVYSIKDIYLENIRSVDYLFYVIFVFIGSCGLFSFNNFLMIFLSLEILSLSSYILVAYDRHSIASSESGIKYLILGGISTISFLLGVSLIYFYSGLIDLDLYSKMYISLTTDLLNNNIYFVHCLGLANLFLIISLLFKLGAAPFHFWLADVYEGAPASVGFFLAIIPKLSFFFLIIKFFEMFGVDYNFILIIIYLSLILGSFLTLIQKKTKRFIAYSSITHIGFALLPVISGVEMFSLYAFIYFIHYILISFMLWLFILIFFNAQKKKIRNLIELSSLFFLRPILAFCFAIIILSLAGIPPFLGFWAKFWALFSLTQIQAYFLIIIVLIVSFIAIQYYIKLLKLIFYEDSQLSFFTIISKASIFSLSFFIISLLFFSLTPFIYMDAISNLLIFKGCNFFNLSINEYQYFILLDAYMEILLNAKQFINSVQTFQNVALLSHADVLQMFELPNEEIIRLINSIETDRETVRWGLKLSFETFLAHDNINELNVNRVEALDVFLTLAEHYNTVEDILNNATILKYLCENKPLFYPVVLVMYSQMLTEVINIYSVALTLNPIYFYSYNLNPNNLLITLNALHEFKAILSFVNEYPLDFIQIQTLFGNLFNFSNFIHSLDSCSSDEILNILKNKFPNNKY